MSDNVCQYYNCRLSRRDNPNLKMFRFPYKNRSICERWILNSGKQRRDRILCWISSEKMQDKFNCLECSSKFHNQDLIAHQLDPKKTFY